MEKYTKAQMDVIEFENEDVITSSGCNGANVSVGGWGDGGTISGGAMECTTD